MKEILSIFPLTGFLVIIVMLAVKVVFLKIKGVSVSTKHSGRSVKALYFSPLFLIIFLIWLAALLEQSLQGGMLTLPSWLTNRIINQSILAVTGAFLVVISVIVMGITLIHFKSSLRFGLSRQNKGALITNGIFSYTRNPFFVSLDLFFMGQALVFPGIIFIIIALSAVIAIHFYILREEKFMENEYGVEYINYRRKVRRYF